MSSTGCGSSETPWGLQEHLLLQPSPPPSTPDDRSWSPGWRGLGRKHQQNLPPPPPSTRVSHQISELILHHVHKPEHHAPTRTGSEKLSMSPPEGSATDQDDPSFIYLFWGKVTTHSKKKKITFDSVTLYKYTHTRNRYKNFTKQQIPLVHAMSSYVSVLFYFLKKKKKNLVNTY